jgi:hypothetical protein
MSRTVLCNAALMVRHSNFYSSFNLNFSRIFCSSFKLFENQTVRLSRVQCIFQNIKHREYYYMAKNDSNASTTVVSKRLLQFCAPITFTYKMKLNLLARLLLSKMSLRSPETSVTLRISTCRNKPEALSFQKHL